MVHYVPLCCDLVLCFGIFLCSCTPVFRVATATAFVLCTLHYHYYYRPTTITDWLVTLRKISWAKHELPTGETSHAFSSKEKC